MLGSDYEKMPLSELRHKRDHRLEITVWILFISKCEVEKGTEREREGETDEVVSHHHTGSCCVLLAPLALLSEGGP